jgi:hypothetical protein
VQAVVYADETGLVRAGDRRSANVLDDPLDDGRNDL